MYNTDKFLKLFNPYPGNTFLEVSDEVCDLSDKLREFLESRQSKINLALYCQKDDLLKEKFENSKIQYIPDLQKPFRGPPRSVDIVILKNIFSKHQSQEALLKAAYTMLANAAQVVIIEPKGSLDKTTMLALLESTEFRAANFVDIFNQHDVIVAKKMHMWGNGL